MGIGPKVGAKVSQKKYVFWFLKFFGLRVFSGSRKSDFWPFSRKSPKIVIFGPKWPLKHHKKVKFQKSKSVLFSGHFCPNFWANFHENWPNRQKALAFWRFSSRPESQGLKLPSIKGVGGGPGRKFFFYCFVMLIYPTFRFKTRKSEIDRFGGLFGSFLDPSWKLRWSLEVETNPR